jgi:hypothetical protein
MSAIKSSGTYARFTPVATTGGKGQLIGNGNLQFARGSFFSLARTRRGAGFTLPGVTTMLTIAVVLLVLWLLGLVSSYTIGGLIHILLVAAIVIFLVRAFQGRRPIV